MSVVLIEALQYVFFLTSPGAGTQDMMLRCKKHIAQAMKLFLFW